MDLLGRLAVVFGISLVLTVLLLVLYQDDGTQVPAAPAISQAGTSAAPATGTP